MPGHRPGDSHAVRNLSRHRLETYTYSFPSVDVVLGNATFNPKDIRKLEIRQPSGFSQPVFLDSIQLVKD